MHRASRKDASSHTAIHEPAHASVATSADVIVLVHFHGNGCEAPRNHRAHQRRFGHLRPFCAASVPPAIATLPCRNKRQPVRARPKPRAAQCGRPRPIVSCKSCDKRGASTSKGRRWANVLPDRPPSPPAFAYSDNGTLRSRSHAQGLSSYARRVLRCDAGIQGQSGRISRSYRLDARSRSPRRSPAPRRRASAAARHHLA